MSGRIRSIAVLFLLGASFPVPGLSDEYSPKIASASNDAELALQSFVIPDGMEGSLLAAEPLIANPVAFHVSSDGRVFVCETFRQQVGVEDNRSHMDWLNNDLRLETVEERLAMFRRYLGDEAAGYGIEHDRIRLLSDSDADGTLDQATVFADGFNDILDGTGAGVLEVDGNVYYTCIPKLWMLQDTDGDGKADVREALHHGYGVRVAFRGHDMHGLVRGPDGRIYFSIGDRGFNVITKEGTRLKRPDCGAVFRCDLDGSNLEVFAYGLRNPQELAFDNDGNLFTVDNNSDSGDQARLTYLVQGSDSGWRMYYQYLPDRGPWNRERMWYPFQADEETTAVQPPHIIPPLANISDGPSGLTFYPGLGLSDRYRDHFFLADFRGASANSGIRSFAVTPKGGSFELADSHKFIWSILATDVDFAPDGSLYVTDWVNGWDGEGKGRLYRFADTEHINAVSNAKVPQLLNGGVSAMESDQLFGLLSHADRRIRQAAQFELVKRNEKERILEGMLVPEANEIAQRHLAWASWQLGLASAEVAREIVTHISKLMKRPGRIRTQYLRILADLVSRHGIDNTMTADTRNLIQASLRELLTGDDERETGFAAVALGAVGSRDDALSVAMVLKGKSDPDPVLRHQCVNGLTRLTTRNPDALYILPRAEDPSVRHATILALSRSNNIAWLKGAVGDKDPQVALTAVRELMDERFGVGEAEVIRATRSDRGIPALTRRGLEARYRLGFGLMIPPVAKVAADDEQPVEIRMVAAKMLSTWNTPQQTDTVTGRWRPLPEREIDVASHIRGDLPMMLDGPPSIREEAIRIAALYGINDVAPQLENILQDENQPESIRVAAVRAFAKLSDDPEDVIAKAAASPSEAVRTAALEINARQSPMAALPAIRETLRSGSVKSQQTAVRLLGEMQLAAASKLLEQTFDELLNGERSNAIALELITAAESNPTDELKRRVQLFRDSQREAGTKSALFTECLEGGNADRGRNVFFGRAAASCRRCHTVNGEGAAVGPDLSAIAKDKDRAYLLEAIVDPNAKIAKGFETTIIIDFDGRIHSGIIKEENDQLVKLVTPKGAVVSVPADEIEERAEGKSGMPSDIINGLTRAEIRDLVEYLSTLKSAKTGGAHGNEGENQ